jgi:hypothetical protein
MRRLGLEANKVAEEAAASFRAEGELENERARSSGGATSFAFFEILLRFRLHLNIGAQKMTIAYRLKVGCERMASADLACDSSHARGFYCAVPSQASSRAQLRSIAAPQE